MDNSPILENEQPLFNDNIQSSYLNTEIIRQIRSGNLNYLLEGVSEFQIEFLIDYLANGFCDFEEGMDCVTLGKSLGSFFKRRPAPLGWIQYVEQNLDLEFQQVEVSLEEFQKDEVIVSAFGRLQTKAIIERYFPHLLPEYLANPVSFSFRYVYVDDRREEDFGDIQTNIKRYGVDFNLSLGWEGIWTRSEFIYGSGFNPSEKYRASYLLIYKDPGDLLGGHGFYDEGALNFERLVSAGKTLKDLLVEGGVLKVTK